MLTRSTCPTDQNLPKFNTGRITYSYLDQEFDGLDGSGVGPVIWPVDNLSQFWMNDYYLLGHGSGHDASAEFYSCSLHLLSVHVPNPLSIN